MDFTLTRPCNNCPFRKTPIFYLGTDKRKEIAAGLQDDTTTFPCHKTVYGDRRQAQQCAGAMILLEKSGSRNIAMRLAMRIGQYRPDQLRDQKSVYSSFDQFIAAEEVE